MNFHGIQYTRVNTTPPPRAASYNQTHTPMQCPTSSTCLSRSERGWPIPPAAPKTATLACLGADTLKLRLPAPTKLQATFFMNPAIASTVRVMIELNHRIVGGLKRY